MAKYRNCLPQLSGDLFITSGGMETTLIYHEHIQLPCFASFNLLKDESGCEWMKNYLRRFVNIAKKYHIGYILQSATWRANPDWIKKLGYSDEDLNNFNRKSIEILEQIRNEYERENFPIVLNGCIGPRGDGYNPTLLMSPQQAQLYHSKQIQILSQTNADMITAFTLNYPEEAIGIVRAAKDVGMPIIISFTVETDGKLPTGQTLKEAIQIVDNATDNGPAYYMINCAHPTHIEHLCFPNEDWISRIRGIKGNASKKSHAQLNESKELDEGNPIEFGEDIRKLLYKLKHVNVLGGCCGTDDRHVEQICKSCVTLFDRLKHNHPYEIEPK
jgi:S-methylmethionine-dependent homocysteine/selenocysteine methylase